MSSALVSRSAWGHEATSEGSQPCIHSTQRARPTLVVLIIISDTNNLKALLLFKALHREAPSSEVERGRSWLCQSSRRPAYFARSSLSGGLEDPEVMVLLFCVVGIMLMMMLLAVSVLSLIANLIHVHLVAEVQVGHVGRHHWVPLEVWHPL